MHKSNVSEIRHRLCAPASRTSKTFLTRVQPVMGYVGPSAAAAALDAHSLLRVRTFQDGRRLRLILQTMNKPEWLKQIEMGPSLLVYKFSLTRFVKISEFKNNDKLVKTK